MSFSLPEKERGGEIQGEEAAIDQTWSDRNCNKAVKGLNDDRTERQVQRTKGRKTERKKTKYRCWPRKETLAP